MYTELKELVNFLAKFTRNRIPRRRMSIFLEHLANGLLVKHEAAWKVDNPISGATERAIRINTASGTTELLTSVASTLGIDIHALLSSFPMEMVAFWNPGEVFYRLGDTPTNLPIWSGDVNADTNYSCAPARLYTFEPGFGTNAIGRTATPGHNSMPSANVGSECNYVRLELAPWDQHSDFYWSTDVFSPSNNANGGAYTIVKQNHHHHQQQQQQQQSRAAGIMNGIAQQHVHPTNQYYAMGDAAMLKYLASAKKNAQGPRTSLGDVASKTLQLRGGDAHHSSTEVPAIGGRTSNQFRVPTALYMPHANLLNNAGGDGVVYGAAGTAVPREGTNSLLQVSAVNPGHHVVYANVMGRGDGQNIEHASVQEVAFNQHNPHPIFSTGTGGDRLMRGATIATTSQEGASGSMRSNNGESIFDTEQPNAQNYVRNEETGMPDNVGLNDGEQNVTGNAKKWKDLA